MNILNAFQLKEADQRTMDLQQISSWELMERASSALFHALIQDYPLSTTYFVVVCGPGNNGGDGLALARMIAAAEGMVQVWLLSSTRYTPDNLKNQRLLESVHCLSLQSSMELPKDAVVIDALYGYGLNRPLSAEYSLLFDSINRSARTVVAVDMPSGLLADQPTPSYAPILHAHKVYTFHCPKKALLLPDNAQYVGDFQIIDIGLCDTDYSTEQYLTTDLLRPTIIRPGRFAHKGYFGHALIAGGALGKMGAVQLTTGAALRSGCGLVTGWVPKCGLLPMQINYPEAMVLASSAENFIDEFPADVRPYTAIGIGPGMGLAVQTSEALLAFLTRSDLPPLVIDADALNIIAQKDLILPPETILTPHPKELERLLGSWGNDFHKLDKVRKFCSRHKVICIVKGANTAVIKPDGSISFNATGNNGMAKGGTGDALTGIITGLLAQKYTPVQAAELGVFLHGLAGDIARDRMGAKGMNAGDIVRAIPTAWRHLDSHGSKNLGGRPDTPK